MDGSIASGTPKIDWQGAPSHVRSAVESLVGASVIDAVTMPGGFNPGVAALLTFDSGATAFVKAVGEDLSAAAAQMHRREAEVVRSLACFDEVPDLLGQFEDQGWVTLVFRHVRGQHPTLPWQRDELRQVLDAHASLTGRLTPSPVQTVALAEADDEFDCWRHLAERPRLLNDLGLAWAVEHLDQILEVQSGWREAIAGETLLHGDLRADQILLDDRQVVFVDWPHACTGSAWADVVMMIPSIALHGGPPPEDVIDVIGLSPQANPVNRDELMAFAAATAGGLLWYSTKPPPPGLPTVRQFQHAQGRVLLEWIGRQRRWIARHSPPE